MIIRDEQPLVKTPAKDESEKIHLTLLDEELTKSTEYLSHIINFLPDATFVIDSAGRVIAWNKVMENMTQIKADEMLGKGSYEYSIPFYGERRKILVDIVLTAEDEVEDKYDQIQRENSSITAEIFIPSFNGKPTYLWGKATRFYDENGAVVGAIESIRDITEKKLAVTELKKHRDHLEELVEERTEELRKTNLELQVEIEKRKQIAGTLRRSEENYRSIFENAGIGIFQSTLEGKFIKVNSTLARMFGYQSPEEMMDSVYDIDQQIYTNQERRLEVLRKIKESSGIVKLENEFRRKDGETWTADLNLRVVSNQKSKPIHFEGFMEDITDRKKVEQDLHKLNEKLKRSNNELEQFAYVASHDLQEPLRMVASFTQLLEKEYKDQLDENATDYIEFIVDGAKRMQLLIEDLLSYSRVTSTANEFEAVNLEKVMDDVLFNLEISIEENKAEITRDVLPKVRADYSQMVQVFQNLLANSIKYRDEENPEIHISAEEQDDHWLFAVADNGIGMDGKYSEQIFQIFRRLHTQDEYEGTGIGLAITKRIIEKHDGRIWVESEPGKGSTFCFIIPEI